MKPKTLIRLQPPDKSKLEKARQLRYTYLKPLNHLNQFISMTLITNEGSLDLNESDLELILFFR